MTTRRAWGTPVAIALAILLIALGLLHRPEESLRRAIAGLAVYWMTLGWAGARLASWLLSGPRTTTERLTTGFTVTVGLLVTPLVGLGHFGLLSARNAMLTAAAILLACRFLPVSRRPPRSRPRSRESAGHAVAALAAVVACAVVLAVSLGASIQSARYLPAGVNGYDDTYYHLPAAVEWLQHGDLRMLKIGFGDPSPAFYPIATELVAWSHLALLSGNDFTARFVELPFALGCLIAIAATARALGLRTSAAVVAALLFATMPGFPRHMLSAGNDLATAFFTLASVHAIVLFARRPEPRRAVYLGCAVGLLFGTKYTALVFGPPLVLLAGLVAASSLTRRAASGRRLGVRTVAGFLLLLSLTAGAATLTGGYTYLRNAVTAGNPIFPATVAIGGHVVLRGWRSHTPQALYDRRRGTTPPVEFLWGRDDLFGPLFRWTLLPAALAVPALVLLMGPRSGRRSRSDNDPDAGGVLHEGRPGGRRRLRRDRLLAAALLSLPAVFYAGFLYLIADQRGARYLLPAVALAAVAFAWLVEAMPSVWRSAVMIALAVVAAPVVVLQFGYAFPLWWTIATPLVAAALSLVPRLLRRSRSGGASPSPSRDRYGFWSRQRLVQLRRKPYSASVGLLVTAGLVFATVSALARTAEKYAARRLDPRGAAAFVERVTESEPAVIAYAGNNRSYLFFGRHLRNEILYVPTYDVEEAPYYSWGGSPVRLRGPRDQRAWYRNLARLGVRYLIVQTVYGTPPELPWIERLPCCHELLWHRDATRVYALRADELARHLAAESPAEERSTPRG